MADSGWNTKTLKEHFEKLLASELAARDRALDLQSAELARRLDVLNHAHERSASDQAKFVHQDVYDQRHDDLERRFAVLETWRANVAGRTAGMGVLLAVAVAIVTALVTHMVA